MKFLFGPVKSRRLGISLGVDLVPHKTCTLDCIYCECGATTDLTVDIKEYVPTDEVISELKDYLSSSPQLDIITFSGAGEPTLHKELGTIISFIRKNYPYRVAVLTNSTLLWKKEVRKALMGANLVVPSIDSVTEKGLGSLNRCHKEVTPQRIVEGLQLFTKEFQGEVILEIFIVEGINDSDEELNAVIDVCKTLRYDGIQINILDRPGTEKWVRPLTAEKLRYVYLRFRDLGAELIGMKESSGNISTEDLEESVAGLISRRPATIEDLSIIFGQTEESIIALLNRMKKFYNITESEESRGVFYRIR